MYFYDWIFLFIINYLYFLNGKPLTDIYLSSIIIYIYFHYRISFGLLVCDLPLYKHKYFGR